MKTLHNLVLAAALGVLAGTFRTGGLVQGMAVSSRPYDDGRRTRFVGSSHPRSPLDKTHRRRLNKLARLSRRRNRA